jgi:hypothetical protein
MDLYLYRGFQVGTVLMDNKFENLRVLIPILVVNTTAVKEYVPEVERRIHLLKGMRERHTEHPPVQKDAPDHDH